MAVEPSLTVGLLPRCRISAYLFFSCPTACEAVSKVGMYDC